MVKQLQPGKSWQLTWEPSRNESGHFTMTWQWTKGKEIREGTLQQILIVRLDTTLQQFNSRSIRDYATCTYQVLLIAYVHLFSVFFKVLVICFICFMYIAVYCYSTFIHCTTSHFRIGWFIPMGCDETTSLTLISWCNSRGLNSTHHRLYTMASADSKLDDSSFAVSSIWIAKMLTHSLLGIYLHSFHK